MEHTPLRIVEMPRWNFVQCHIKEYLLNALKKFLKGYVLLTKVSEATNLREVPQGCTWIRRSEAAVCF